MNIYQKIQNIKSELNQMQLKKSGKNEFAKYTYYELSDFLPQIVELCKNSGVMTFVSFTTELATLIAVNSEKPEETLTISSPMKELDLKGCNSIQALGGVETYQRRYLYMALFDIVENDMFDGGDGDKSKPKKSPLPEQKNTQEKTPLQKAQAELIAAMNEKVKKGMTKDEILQKLKIFNSEKTHAQYDEKECRSAIEFLKVLE